MSVPKGMRSKSKLEAAIKARELAAHTIKITSNPKKFPAEFRELLGKNYAEVAIKIFNSCWAANNIRVTNRAACQKKKGTDFCRNRMKCHLQRFYRQNKLSGYILECDVAGYYPNMKSEVAENVFTTNFPKEIADEVVTILRTQYGNEGGYFPGSQLLQLVGIAALNGLDHYIKEKLHIKHYVRYMDDFLLIHDDKAYLEECRRRIADELATLGMTLHPKKTKIIPVSQEFKFLGFIYRLTKTGKVLMFVNPQTVKEERQRLRKMARLVKNGRMTKAKYEECYQCWRAHAMKGSSSEMTRRMDKFHKDLLL